MSFTEDVKKIFNGGIVVRLDLVCPSCDNKGRIIKAVKPDHERWQCHFCGREAIKPKGEENELPGPLAIGSQAQAHGTGPGRGTNRRPSWRWYLHCLREGLFKERTVNTAKKFSPTELGR